MSLGTYTEDATLPMLERLAELVKDAGCYEASAVPGTWSASGSTWTCSTKHTLEVGNVIVLQPGFTGTTNLKELWVFFVKEVPSETTAVLSRQKAATKAWTLGAAVSNATFERIKEETETRQAVSWTLGSGTGEAVEADATAVVIPITAGNQTTNYVCFDSKAKVEAGDVIYFCVKVSPEHLETAGSIEIKRSEFDLSAA